MTNPDRRIQRTRQLLTQAVVELIVEKGYDAVTVQDIIDRANIGRSTFYAHFTDKENLLLSGLDRLFQGFEAAQSAEALQHNQLNLQQINLALLQHVQSHQVLYQALVSKGSSQTIIKQVLVYFFQYIADHLKKQPRVAETAVQLNIPLELLTHHLAGALLTLMEWWLNNNLPYSAEELSAIFTRLTLQPLHLESLN